MNEFNQGSTDRSFDSDPISVLDEEQIFTVKRYFDNVEDPLYLQQAVDTLVSKEAYLKLHDEITVTKPETDASPVSQLYDSYAVATAILLATFNLEKTGEDESEKSRISTSFVTSVMERCAAHEIVRSQVLRNLPNRQAHELANSITSGMSIDESRINSDLANNFLMSFVGLKNIQQHLQNVANVQRKEHSKIPQLADDSASLLKSVNALRKYRVKSVYMAERSALPVVDWHVYDMEQEIFGHSPGERGIATARSDSVATFDGFTDRLLDEPAEKEQVKVFDHNLNGAYLSYRVLKNGDVLEKSEDVRFLLHKDGYLTATEGAPLEPLCDELGLSVEYQIYLSRAVSMYADMVLPAEVLDSSSDIRDSEDNLRKTSNRAKIKAFREIVLARLRILEDDQDIEEKIEAEHKIERRKSAKHPVIGHIKKIPKHHRASARQRELCRQYMNGRELAPYGETYVHDFIRGNSSEGVEIKGHRGSVRYVGGSVLRDEVQVDEL